MNGGRRSARAPPTWSAMSHRVIFEKDVIFRRAHWPAGSTVSTHVGRGIVETLIRRRRAGRRTTIIIITLLLFLL